MSGKRNRPDRQAFAALCAAHTRTEIAEICDAHYITVIKWEQHYGIRAIAGRAGRPRRTPVQDAAPVAQEATRKEMSQSGQFNKRAVERQPEPKPGALIPLKARVRNTVIGPRTGITAPSDRQQRDEHRDRLAQDVERYLAGGGEIETLPGPGNAPSRRAFFTGGVI